MVAAAIRPTSVYVSCRATFKGLAKELRVNTQTTYVATVPSRRCAVQRSRWPTTGVLDFRGISDKAQRVKHEQVRCETIRTHLESPLMSLFFLGGRGAIRESPLRVPPAVAITADDISHGGMVARGAAGKIGHAWAAALMSRASRRTQIHVLCTSCVHAEVGQLAVLQTLNLGRCFQLRAPYLPQEPGSQ